MTIANLLKFEICEDLLENCPFSTSPTVCTNNFCTNSTIYQSCTTNFPTAASCCTKPNPPACLASYQASHTDDPDRTGACARVRSSLLSCNSNANFATAAPSVQASCLCYDKSGAYVPTQWDDAARSCYLEGQSAHPVLYSLLVESGSAALGLCTASGVGGSVTVTATATATATASGSGSGSGVTGTGSMAVTGSVASASAASASAASASASTTQAKSAGLKTYPLNRKFFMTGLFIIFPTLLTAAVGI